MTSTLPSEAPLFPLVFSRLFPAAEGPLAAGGVWIQGVSVGEVEVAITLALEIEAQRPDLPILLTSTTPAGVGLLSRRRPGGWRPFPVDLPSTVRRFFDVTSPRVLVLVETELWPAVLSEARRRRIPVLVVNARLSERSARRYLRAGRLIRSALDALSLVLARTPEDAARFLEIGIAPERVAVGGDLKFDRAAAPEPSFAEAVRRLAAGRPILVAGSIAEAELSFVFDIRRRLETSGASPFLVLAPRRPETFDGAARRAAADGLVVIRRSGLGGETPAATADVLLLDTVGELAGAYALGDAALLGGTFTAKGGHNVLEPLRAGTPVVHGPSISNIRSTLEAAAGAVFPAEGAPEAAAALRPLLTDPETRSRAAEAALALFARHAGAARTAAQAALALVAARATDA